MSQQTSLTDYFKSKSFPTPIMSAKKRSLSLKRTWTPGQTPSTTPNKSTKTPNVSPKTPKISPKTSTMSPNTPSISPKTPIIPPKALTMSPKTLPMSPKTPTKDVVMVEKEDVVTLSSDDEFEETPSKKRSVGISVRSIESMRSESMSACKKSIEDQGNTSAASDDSATTFVYNLSPGTILGPVPRTPISSPSSSKGFYSPTKKRLLKKKSPVKRNLASQFNENLSPNSVGDRPASQKFEYKDDKTGFLLSIIDKYLKSDTLRPLLEEDSQEILEKCLQVAEPGMKLICRLYWRQRGWYRMEELGPIASEKKENISSPDLYNIVSTLKEYGLLTQAGTDGEPELEFDDYEKLLKRPDFLQVTKELNLKMKSKQDAVEALRKFSKQAPISNFYTGNKVNNNSARVLAILKSKTGPCFKMSDLARNTLYNLYVLMYLGMDYTTIREKKLELLLINEKINRETFPVDKTMVVDDASVVFQDRGEFNRYLEAHMIYENYLEKTDVNDKCDIVKQSYNLYKGIEEEHMLRYKSLPTWLRRFTPPNLYIKIMESGVQELKKLKTEDYYNLAVLILDALIGQIGFRQHKKALWYAEKALILHSHLDSSEKAAKILLEGFKTDMPEELKDAMRPRALKIANQQNIDLKETFREELRVYANKETILESNLPGEHIYKQPVDNHNQKGKLKFVMYSADGKATLTAEDYCIAHYIHNKQYTNGMHWEGRIVSTIYFLLFWDIIYSKPRGVAGIFMSHYQRYPLDMFSESFYLNRKTLLDERLLFIQECTEDMLLEMMKNNWDERPESEISEVQRSTDWELVSEVTLCLRPRGVAAVCRRLVHNYGYARSGFPDLTLWNIHTKTIKFVEVKTDADKPSVKQLQWLQYLNDNGIPAGFCYVGVNTTRSRARPSANSTD